MAWITLADGTWGTNPKIPVVFKYDRQRNGSAMQYKLYVEVGKVNGSSSYGYYIDTKLYLDGVERAGTRLKGNSPSQWSGKYTYETDWINVDNKTSGTTTLGVRMLGGSGRDKTYEYSLIVDPAYPIITGFSVDKIDEISVRLNWSADSICDYAWYSIDNGSSWIPYDIPDASNGSFNIGGLSAGQTYNFKIQLRRRDSQLSTASGVYTQSTYPYPSITNVINSDLLVGDGQTITINNPLSRSCVVKMVDSEGNEELYSGTTNGTSITFVPTDTVLQNKLVSANTQRRVANYTISYGNVVRSTKQGYYRTIFVDLLRSEWSRPNQLGDKIDKDTLSGNIFLRPIGGVNNKISVKYAYKEEEQEEFSSFFNVITNIDTSNDDVSLDSSNNSFDILKAIEISNLDYSKRCLIKVVVEDNYTRDEAIVEIMKGIPVWWWTEDYFAVAKKLMIGDLTIEVVDD